MDDRIIAQCQCGQKYKIPPEKAGKMFRCKSCGAAFSVGAADASAGQESETGGETPRTETPASTPAAPAVAAPVAAAENASTPVAPAATVAPVAPAPIPTPTAAPVPRPAVVPAPAAPAINMKVVGNLEAKDPDELMSDVNASIITKTFIISLILHAVLLGATSFGLYRDWRQFGIMMPYRIKEQKKAIAEEARQKALQEERQKKEAEKKAAAEKAAAEAKAQKPAEKPAEKTADGTTPDNRSEYQKKVEEVKKDRPGSSSLQLDTKDLNLE